MIRFCHRLSFAIVLVSLSLGIRAQQKMSITGTIEYADPAKKLSLEADVLGLGVQPVKWDVPLKGERFELNLDLGWPQLGKLRYGQDSADILLLPGQQVNLSFHGDAMAASMEFTGNGAADQAFFKAFQKQYGGDMSMTSISKLIQANQIDMYELELFTQHENQQKFLADQKSKHQVSDAAYNFAVDMIDYHYQASLLAFPVVKGEASKEPTISHLPQIMLAEFKTPLANDAALGCPQYQLFLWYAAAYFAYEKASFSKPADASEALKLRREAAVEKVTGKSLSYLLARLTVANLGFASAEEIKLTREACAKTAAGLQWLPEVDRMIQAKPSVATVTPADIDAKGKSKTKGSGESKHKFYMIGLDGQSFNLSKFEGKVVYVDFWASWCGPCRGQFPYAKELHDKFTPKQLKDIVFLYISIDNTEQAWKTAIEKLGLMGEHGYCPGGWEAEVCRYFQITSIPRYMLLNKKGEIVTPNAPRPSDPSIYDTLLQLMAE